MASMSGKIHSCNDCGLDVVWAISKNGKKYLASIQEWSGDMTFAVRVFLPSHKCTPNAEWQRINAAAEASILAEGRLVKGQEIEVIKGRKVAKGTTGIIFWVSDEADRVGFKNAEGESFFIAASNVIATNQKAA